MDLLKGQGEWNELTTEQKRSELENFEKICKAQPQVELETVEHYASGVYARTIHIPRGVELVGEIHLKDQINIVSKGVIRVVTEEGVEEIVAPAIFVSKAGTKRAGQVLEDTVWTVLHASETNDGEAVRKDDIVQDYAELNNYLEKDIHVMGSNSDNHDLSILSKPETTS